MANQFSKGHVFVPGEVVDPDDLNNLVDLATALPPLITNQTGVNAASGDKALLVRAGALKQADVSTFPQGVTSVSAVIDSAAAVLSFSVQAGTAATAPILHIGLDNQTANKLLAGPTTGSATTPGFRTLVPGDISVATSGITAATIDWSLSNTFIKTLTGATTFLFTNVEDGQTIQVRVKQDASGGRTVAWNPTPLAAIVWVGGVAPVVNSAPNAYSIFVFTAIKDSSTGVMLVHGYMESTVSNTSSFGNQPANTFLAGPVTGPDGLPTFRQIALADTTLYVNVPSHIIDCTLGNSFQKILHGVSDTLHINNGIPGQRIKVFLQQGDVGGPTTLTWTTDDASGVLRWPGSVHHTMTTGAIANVDIVDFFCTGGGQYWGTFDKNFAP